MLSDLEQAERVTPPECMTMSRMRCRPCPTTSASTRRFCRVCRRLPWCTPEDVRGQLNNAEPWHRTDKSGALRAAIFGVSDRLVSNTALVMGFCRHRCGRFDSSVRGLRRLLAGAFPWRLENTWSVASQTDLFRRELALEAQELEEKPLEEQRELELIYRAKGLDANTARITAERIMRDPQTALDTLAREELGLDPDDLGDPKRVAASSFGAFAIGASVPVIRTCSSPGRRRWRWQWPWRSWR